MESTPLDMTCQCGTGCLHMRITRAMLVSVCDCAMHHVCNLSNWLKKLLVPTVPFVRLQNMVAASPTLLRNLRCVLFEHWSEIAAIF